MSLNFDLDWAANFNLSQRKNDYLVVDSDPDSDAPAVPRDILIRDPDSDGVSFRATLNDQLVLTDGVSRVTINARGDTTKAEVIGVSGGPTIITPQPRSTGLLTGGEIVAGGVPASEFTVETGTGVIWDGTTDPSTPTLTPTITWTEFTDETTIGVETFVYITSVGALNLSASKTPALDRSHLFLGVVLDSGTSLTIINAPITANQIGSYLSDLYAEIAIMINDVVITPNANLTVQNSAGTAFGQSINWHTDRTTPNEIAISANNPMPMTYVTQDGDFAASTVTNMDVANYNPSGGTISAIGGGARNSTNQRIYITPFGFATLYGQNIFSSLDAAVDGADTENPVVPEWLLNYGTLLVTVSVIRTATDLSDDTQAKFNYSAAGGSAGDNHDHSRLDSPDGLIVPVLFTDNSGNVATGTDAPAPDSRLHVFAGSAGAVTAPADTVITIENSTDAYLAFLTPDADESGFFFGEPSDNDAAAIIHNPSTLADGLEFRVDGNTTFLSISAAETAINEGGADHNVRVEAVGLDDALFVQGSNGDIGIGTDAPAFELEISRSGSSSVMGVTSYGGTPRVQGRTANGTEGSPTTVVDNELLFSFRGFGYGSSQFNRAADVEIRVDGTPSGNDVPAALRFVTHALGDSVGTINERMRLTPVGNLGLGTSDQFGSGVGVLGIANAGTNPSSNPTGGGVLYSDAGAGKWRGSGGTTTTFGPADPHCPECGRDFVLEWENDKTGHLVICMWCLSETLTKGVVERAKL